MLSCIQLAVLCDHHGITDLDTSRCWSEAMFQACELLAKTQQDDKVRLFLEAAKGAADITSNVQGSQRELWTCLSFTTALLVGWLLKEGLHLLSTVFSLSRLIHLLGPLLCSCTAAHQLEPDTSLLILNSEQALGCLLVLHLNIIIALATTGQLGCIGYVPHATAA